MNDQFSSPHQTTSRGDGATVLRYIETPRSSHRPEKLDKILEKRMREFLLARRRRRWVEKGE